MTAARRLGVSTNGKHANPSLLGIPLYCALASSRPSGRGGQAAWYNSRRTSVSITLLRTLSGTTATMKRVTTLPIGLNKDNIMATAFKPHAMMVGVPDFSLLLSEEEMIFLSRLLYHHICGSDMGPRGLSDAISTAIDSVIDNAHQPFNLSLNDDDGRDRLFLLPD